MDSLQPNKIYSLPVHLQCSDSSYFHPNYLTILKPNTKFMVLRKEANNVYVVLVNLEQPVVYIKYLEINPGDVLMFSSEETSKNYLIVHDKKETSQVGCLYSKDHFIVLKYRTEQLDNSISLISHKFLLLTQNGLICSLGVLGTNWFVFEDSFRKVF